MPELQRLEIRAVSGGFATYLIHINMIRDQLAGSFGKRGYWPFGLSFRRVVLRDNSTPAGSCAGPTKHMQIFAACFRTILASAPYCLCCALFSVLLGAPAADARGTAPPELLPPITIYATQMAHPNTNTTFVFETYEAIAKAFAPRPVTFEMVSIRELDQLVYERKANVVMAGAGFYRRHLHDGLRDVATLVSPLQPNPDRAVGSVIVTLKERTDIQTLEDLKGKTVSVNAPTGFQGIMITKNELQLAGFNPEKFFGRVTYVGMDLLPSIDLLECNRVDAAILTSCLMEEAKARGMTWVDWVKPIAVREQNDIACKVSTALYPNWSVMLTPTLDATTTWRIVSAIHAMPASSDGIEWAVASNFGAVDEMYRNLRLGPYEHLRLWTVK